MADETKKLAGSDAQIHVLDGDQAAESSSEILNRNRRHFHGD